MEQYFNNDDQIGVLIYKYTQDELTEEERDTLNRWIAASADNKVFFKEMLNSELLLEEVMDRQRARQESNKTEVWKRMVRENLIPHQRRFFSIDGRWRTYSAAAFLLICMSLAVYILLIKSKNAPGAEKRIISTHTPEEIMPAANKATLTLSDGKTIVLSDADDGTVAEDGRTVINKKRDGELVYQPNVVSTNSVLANHSAYNTVVTPKGGKYQVSLPDGTKVWLNAASSLRFPVAFAETERRVELSGEAYFQVSKNPAKPFRVIISSGNKPLQEIEVLGTHFNVGAYQDEPATNTTLLEGSITVSSRAAVSSTFSRTLLPGQRVTVSRSSSEFLVTTPEDPTTSIAWVSGKFSFEKNDVYQVMRELSRWYNIDIRFEGTGELKQLVSGDIERTMPLSKLLSNLERMMPVKFSLEGKTVIVKKK